MILKKNFGINSVDQHQKNKLILPQGVPARTNGINNPPVARARQNDPITLLQSYFTFILIGLAPTSVLKLGIIRISQKDFKLIF